MSFRTVPGAPYLRLGGGPRLPTPTPFWFSFERHALESWLRFEEARRGARLDAVLVPDFMCHEVVNSLRDARREAVFFPLGPDFSVDPARVAEALAPRRGRAAVFMCHFYGRLVRSWAGVAEACRAAGAPLAEDCAHLPYPDPEDAAPAAADVRLYTFRKVYGVPYGATARLRSGQAEFNAFAAERSGPKADGDTAGLLAWGARELVKRAAIAARLPLRRAYRDLSQDPLKPFEAAHPWAEGFLGAGEPERARRRRRENHALYRAADDVFRGWAEPLACDGEGDVPYQLLLTLSPRVEPREFISFCLARGVSALAGLALHEDVLRALPAGHPYLRQAALPLHQDVSAEDVAYVLEVARAFRRERGL